MTSQRILKGDLPIPNGKRPNRFRVLAIAIPVGVDPWNTATNAPIESSLDPNSVSTGIGPVSLVVTQARQYRPLQAIGVASTDYITA